MGQITAYKSYQEYKHELDAELTKTAEGFVRIGYLLKVARDTDILKESGYANVVDFAKAEYGIDKTQVSRFIHINDKFSEGGYSDHLLPEYQGFGYAKLSLMMLLPDEINEELSPDYSKADIQSIKDEVDAESQITDIEVMLEEKDPAEKDLSLITQVIRRTLEENPEVFRDIHKAFQERKSIEELQNILGPNGDKVYNTRIPGIGRMMLIIKDKSPDVILINMRQGNEKTFFPWPEILQVISWLIKTELPVEDAWRQQYDTDFPLKKAQVAPVQPKRKESRVVPHKKPEPKKPEKQPDPVKAEPVKEAVPEKPRPEAETEKKMSEERQEDVHEDLGSVQNQPDNDLEVEKAVQTDPEAAREETVVGQQDGDTGREATDAATDLADTPPEKVEGTPLYVRRKYMSHLQDEELADYLMRELKPRILTSRPELIRWLQEEV